MSPKFKIGFELEGLVRWGRQSAFDKGLHSIARGIDRGTDGSVEGRFKKKKTDRPYYDYYAHDDGNGIEIRTPPMPIEKGIEVFDEILDYLASWTKQEDFATNETCGLHVNISEERMAKTNQQFCDWYGHLVAAFPEHRVLAMFRRTNNHYCQPLFTRAEQKDKDAAVISTRALNGNFGRSKYHSVGLHTGHDGDETMWGSWTPKDRRVEFRCLGNKDYHRKPEKLHDALDIIQNAANIAFYKVMGRKAVPLDLETYSRSYSIAQPVACPV